MPEHVDDFIRIERLPDTMSFLELRAYVAKLRSGGHLVQARPRAAPLEAVIPARPCPHGARRDPVRAG